jgi:peptidyl-prolyl cis-trans isomerase D
LDISMLSIFRRGPVAKIMLGVLALGVFAIVITGFGTDGMGGLGGTTGATGGSLVSAGDEEITTAEMTDQVNRQLDRARQQNPELDVGTFFAGGGYEEILRQLVGQKAMMAFGEEVGITASKRMVDGEIASIPAFKNLAGQFDAAAFRAAIQREGVSEDQLRRELAQARSSGRSCCRSRDRPECRRRWRRNMPRSARTAQRHGRARPCRRNGQGPRTERFRSRCFLSREPAPLHDPRAPHPALRGDRAGAGRGLPHAPTEREIGRRPIGRSPANMGSARPGRLSQVVLPDQAAARAFAAKLAAGTSFAQGGASRRASAPATLPCEQSKSRLR